MEQTRMRDVMQRGTVATMVACVLALVGCEGVALEAGESQASDSLGGGGSGHHAPPPPPRFVGGRWVTKNHSTHDIYRKSIGKADGHTETQLCVPLNFSHAHCGNSVTVSLNASQSIQWQVNGQVELPYLKGVRLGGQFGSTFTVGTATSRDITSAPCGCTYATWCESVDVIPWEVFYAGIREWRSEPQIVVVGAGGHFGQDVTTESPSAECIAEKPAICAPDSGIVRDAGAVADASSMPVDASSPPRDASTGTEDACVVEIDDQVASSQLELRAPARQAFVYFDLRQYQGADGIIPGTRFGVDLATTNDVAKQYLREVAHQLARASGAEVRAIQVRELASEIPVAL